MRVPQLDLPQVLLPLLLRTWSPSSLRPSLSSNRFLSVPSNDQLRPMPSPLPRLCSVWIRVLHLRSPVLTFEPVCYTRAIWWKLVSFKISHHERLHFILRTFRFGYLRWKEISVQSFTCWVGPRPVPFATVWKRPRPQCV